MKRFRYHPDEQREVIEYAVSWIITLEMDGQSDRNIAESLNKNVLELDGEDEHLIWRGYWTVSAVRYFKRRFKKEFAKFRREMRRHRS